MHFDALTYQRSLKINDTYELVVRQVSTYKEKKKEVRNYDVNDQNSLV